MVFASDVQKQFFMAGLQQNLRDSVPMLQVSEVETENAEYIVNRYGADVAASSTKNSLYRRAASRSYSRDKKSIDEIATVTDVILYQELMREGFDIVADRKDKHAFALRQAIHRHSVDTAVNGAAAVLDAGNLAGGAANGTAITMSSSNPDEVAATIVQILQEANAWSNGTPFVMMTPKQAKFFNLFASGAGFSVADRALTNGIFSLPGGAGQVIRGAQAFMGLDVIVANEMPRTAVLTLSGALTAADTITINGVVLTANASPSTAGHVDVGSSGENQIDLLVAAINNSSYYLAGAGSASDYVEISEANRTIWETAGIRARKLSASTLEVTSFTTLTVAESGSASSWGSVIEHMLAGAYNATTVALPSKGMRSDEKPLAAATGGTGTHGFELTTFQMHDAVVWTYNAPKLVDVLVA